MKSAFCLVAMFVLAIGSPAQTFRAQTIDSSISIGYGLALGDVDGDGKTDILLADQKQIVWYRNGDWKKSVIAENLTELDNVCIAARDIDGDGKVEVAVGAQWNPAETSDTTRSGSVHYLARPADPSMKWTAITLRHEPTVHRMRWIVSNGKPYLVVLPLHGRNNKGGEGEGVKVFAYEFPRDVRGEWKMTLLSDDMHMTHNFAVSEDGGKALLYIAGKEGVRTVSTTNPGKQTAASDLNHSAGEIKMGKQFIATIEPMHGNSVVVYNTKDKGSRAVLDTALREGHGVGVANFDAGAREQVVAGWRNKDQNGEVGIKLYTANAGNTWQSQWIDRNGMACEDLQVEDLNKDGKPDIIASGRATKNVKIYWNESK